MKICCSPCKFDDGMMLLIALRHLSVSLQDHDNDLKVSFEDFKKSIENERLLIEAFGPCSPDSTLLEDFSAKICSINCYDYIYAYKGLCMHVLNEWVALQYLQHYDAWYQEFIMVVCSSSSNQTTTN